jgi:CheY-like chemotaxis protein
MKDNIKSEITFNFANATVLMIDASAISVEVMTGMLAGCGFRRMHKCADLASASDVIKMHSVDLILLDPYSYGEPAYNFVRWIRSERAGPNASAPIMIVTAYTYVREITAARQCGADYVVAKPFSTAGLLQRILWVAESEGRRGELMAPPSLVSSTGSGVEMW